MTKIKVASLLLLSLWSLWAWHGYFQKKNATQTVIVSISDDEAMVVSDTHSVARLTNNFWEWEATGRLALIDSLLDDEALVQTRRRWMIDKTNLMDKANHLIDLQMKAYGLDGLIKRADVQLIPLRGDANGLYIPTDGTIYLNSKMQWQSLSFERFVEVVLHENMHHIMTYAITAFSEKDPLRGDFEALVQAAFFHKTHGMANDQVEPQTVNPQELVAYKTQRAARYAGIIGSKLSAWEMSTRTQEIRVIKRDAGF